jgi:hypothetical protein
LPDMEERMKEGKKKKRFCQTWRKEWRKERKRRDFARHGGRFPYSCVLHWSQNAHLG